MVVNVHILYLLSHCVSFALLIIDFIVILHVRLIRVLLKINQSINHVVHAWQALHASRARRRLAYSWLAESVSLREGTQWLSNTPTHNSHFMCSIINNCAEQNYSYLLTYLLTYLDSYSSTVPLQCIVEIISLNNDIFSAINYKLNDSKYIENCLK